VVVNGQEYLEDLRKASGEQLSFPEALNKVKRSNAGSSQLKLMTKALGWAI
jgi:hypothetical protein